MTTDESQFLVISILGMALTARILVAILGLLPWNAEATISLASLATAFIVWLYAQPQPPERIT